MYRIEDDISAIKEVQRLLGLNETGRYDGKTRSAVLNIQRKHALDENGVTDYETFVAIVKEYRKRKDGIWDNGYLFSPSFPFKGGELSDDAARINEALARVLKNYGYEGVIPRGKYIGTDTISGVIFLREIFGIGKKDEIDAAFMNRLMLELRAIEIKDNYG